MDDFAKAATIAAKSALKLVVFDHPLQWTQPSASELLHCYLRNNFATAQIMNLRRFSSDDVYAHAVHSTTDSTRRRRARHDAPCRAI
jgi:hypothetical protein